MKRRDSEYRGWTLCVVPGRPCLGHTVSREPQHRAVMAKGWAEELVLPGLHRQIDRLEDGEEDSADSCQVAG